MEKRASELEEGFRELEDMGTFADQNHRVTEDTRKGVEGEERFPLGQVEGSMAVSI